MNNAGITRDNLLMRMKDEEWFDIMQTNLTSVYHISKAMLRSMMKNVLVVSSILVQWLVQRVIQDKLTIVRQKRVWLVF